jgi:peptide/nickel transport system ATP-binding protein
VKALLEVRNLSVNIRRGKRLLSALEDICFDIYPGEILGIVGESGCGKSLTALSIPGLLAPPAEISGGSIRFAPGGDGGTATATENDKGSNLLALGEKELCRIRGKEISMIFQEPFSSLNPLMKAGSQIGETLELHGEKDKGRIKSRTLELMKSLGLPEPEKLLNAYPHRLSGGMCQRVMIALAVVCRPRLLIADEPTTALDLTTQSQILALMKKINRDLGTSILFISHDLGVIKNLCTRVLVMYAGRIVEEGPVEEVFSRPAHEYTRGLLGSLPGRDTKGRDLANIPGKVPSVEEGRPPGCPFHPRCGKAGERCKGEFPPLRILSGQRRTHCVLGANL